MANGKPGAPKGNKNASMKGIPSHLMTNQLVKALKQYERVSEDDEKKDVKRGMAIRTIMDRVVEAAVEGDKWAIEFITDRVEGKAVQKTENLAPVNTGPIQITFQTSEGRQLDMVGDRVDRELIEHDSD